MPAYIGTCGWSYRHWKDVFYPRGVKPNAWLEYYSQFFPTVEINNTFYYLPKDLTFDHWADRAPAGFLYSVKAPRYITHIQRLANTLESIRRFFGAAFNLEQKLGVVLFQLAPSFKRDDELLRVFLQDVRDRAGIRVRLAFEFRDPSWMDKDVYKILEDHKAALVFSDWGEMSPMRPVTADFVYLRRHGPGGDGRKPYPSASVERDGDAVKRFLSDGLTVFGYYNNDFAGNAVRNARELSDYLGVEWEAEHAGAAGS